MKIDSVAIENPDGLNLVLGQSHFIKTVEDLCELLATAAPGGRFGVAFCEASGPCLIRHAGNDPELDALAVRNAEALACGHSFVIFLRDLFPLNFLPTLKNVPEVCTVFCATANPVTVVVAENETGRGIIGVIDGEKSRGIETDTDIAERKEFLRRIGYKC
ncbi:MAG TPA: adenosine monophosphate-protein transferase [candidate division WOR-3 bacterium]|uniref:Adenosine monophosphate-protein transferase n=1 Tax=candidate division WOR-3 bacterium TaxID=2052148 RepID=A0A7V0XF75_UNCW3|nr:adenosine monophosphate-protein transferase [candidate division WOR-3 bacterium]